MPDDFNAQQMFQILTTEHYNLQSARASTVAEANGRSALFLTSVASGLVALAFVGQRSEMGETFLIFAIVLFPALFFLGIVTFVRVLETSIEDLLLLRGIIRIHHFYAEIAPQVERYFVMPIHDDWKGMSRSMGINRPRGQLLLTAAGMVSVINGILAGAFSAMVLAAVVRVSNLVYAGVGIIVFALTVMLHTRYQVNQRKQANENIGTLFPSPQETGGKQPG
jgi:hypothetical protein